MTADSAIELQTTAVGDRVYRELWAVGVEVIVDGGNERRGVRFRDVELVGVLPRVAVGKRADDVVGWSFFASLGSPCGMRG